MRWFPALLVLVSLAACRGEPALPEAPPARQRALSDRVLAHALQLGRAADTREDAAAALAEVVIPGHSPRLRLIAAADDAVLARGAATALVRILLLRDTDDASALGRCARAESNEWVRAECVRVLSLRGAGALWPIVSDALAAKEAPVREAALELLARRPEIAPKEEVLRVLAEPRLAGDAGLAAARGAVESGLAAAREGLPTDVASRLGSRDAGERRRALRALLAHPSLEVRGDRELESALVHLLQDEDATVKALTAAVWLRRSLAQHPAPLDPGAH